MNEVSKFIDRTIAAVELDNTVTSIGNFAFQSCSNLTHVTVPDTVTSIGNYAFQICTGLTTVNIGSGVTSIGSAAFNGCSNLTSVTIDAVEPPTLGGTLVFGNTNNCPIYVPCDSVDAYKAASGWSDYASRIMPYPTCPVWTVVSSECELDENNANTGFVIDHLADTNPLSDTYGQTETEKRYDTTTCPSDWVETYRYCQVDQNSQYTGNLVIELYNNNQSSASYGQTKNVTVQDLDYCPQGEAQSFFKVSSTSDVNTGYYLIVNETNKKALNGSLVVSNTSTAGLNGSPNTIDVTIDSNRIAVNNTTQTACVIYSNYMLYYKPSSTAYYIYPVASTTAKFDFTTYEGSFDTTDNRCYMGPFASGTNISFANIYYSQSSYIKYIGKSSSSAKMQPTRTSSTSNMSGMALYKLH